MELATSGSSSITLYGRVIDSAGFQTTYSTTVTLLAAVAPASTSDPMSLKVAVSGEPNGNNLEIPLSWTVTNQPDSTTLRYASYIDTGTFPGSYSAATPGGAPSSVSLSGLTDGVHHLYTKVFASDGSTVAIDDFSFDFYRGTTSGNAFTASYTSTLTGHVNITVDSVGGPVANTGYHPILLFGLAGDDTLTVSGDDATDTSAGGGVYFYGQGGTDLTLFSSSAGADSVHFSTKSWVPVCENVTISTGAGNDAINVDLPDYIHLTSLEINGQQDNDMIRVVRVQAASLILNGDSINGNGSVDTIGATDEDSLSDVLEIDSAGECSTLEMNGGYGSDAFILGSLTSVTASVKVNGFAHRPTAHVDWGDGLNLEEPATNISYNNALTIIADLSNYPHVVFDDGDLQTVEGTFHVVPTGGDLLKIDDRSENNTSSVTWDWQNDMIKRNGSSAIDLTTGMDGEATLLSGHGEDWIRVYRYQGMLIESGDGNDTIDMLGGDTLAVPHAATLFGGAGNDRITAGILPSYVNSSTPSGSLADVGTIYIHGGATTVTGSGDGTDTLEIYDDVNDSTTAQSYSITNDQFNNNLLPGYTHLVYTSPLGSVSCIDNLIVHMQNYASSGTPTLNIDSSPYYVAVTVAPGASLNDIINITQEGSVNGSGVADCPPVHIRPSGGSGAQPGDVITVNNSISGSLPTRVVFDYVSGVPLKLHSLDIKQLGSVSFDSTAPVDFLMNVASLSMYIDDAQLIESALNIADYGLKIGSFSGLRYTFANPEGVTATIDEFYNSGFNGGVSTNDKGIFSAVAAASGSHKTVAIITGSAYRTRYGTSVTWGGFAVADGDLLLRCTWLGDATLDRRVDITDLFQLASHYNSTGQNWLNGDFNFDGSVDTVDLGILAAHWQYGTGSSASWSAALSAAGL